jgi:membrane-bound metal-dependent hydrolase YbcI (DUF457 family)
MKEKWQFMRRRTHLILGALAFLAYTSPIYLIEKIPSNTMLMGLFAAFFGSVMPDVLEPAWTWSHRGILHSRRAMRFSGWLFAVTAVLGIFQIFLPAFSLSYLISGFFLGYAVHLLADSVTPAGLPKCQ